MKRKSHSRLKYIMKKRNKLSGIILNEIRGQVCACVKDVKRVEENKPKYLYFVSSFRILGRGGCWIPGPRLQEREVGAAGHRGVFIAGKVSAKLISKDGVIPSPCRRLVPSLCGCTSCTSACSPCRTRADGGSAVPTEGTPAVRAHNLYSRAARGYSCWGTWIIKPQPVFTVVPFFHQLSSPILYFLFFWENSALFNKKNRLLRYTWVLMIDSQAFLIIQLQDRPYVSKAHLKNALEKEAKFEDFPAGCWGLRDSFQASWEQPPLLVLKRGDSTQGSAHILTKT